MPRLFLWNSISSYTVLILKEKKNTKVSGNKIKSERFSLLNQVQKRQNEDKLFMTNTVVGCVWYSEIQFMIMKGIYMKIL